MDTVVTGKGILVVDLDGTLRTATRADGRPGRGFPDDVGVWLNKLVAIGVEVVWCSTHCVSRDTTISEWEELHSVGPLTRISWVDALATEDIHSTRKTRMIETWATTRDLDLSTCNAGWLDDQISNSDAAWASARGWSWIAPDPLVGLQPVQMLEAASWFSDE